MRESSQAFSPSTRAPPETSSTLHDVRTSTRDGLVIPTESALTRIGRATAGFLLPSRCLACDARPVAELFRGGVCRACWRSLPEREGARCDVCDEPLAASGATRCGRCLIHLPPFDSLRAAAPYRGSARSILLAFKFRGADYLGARLAEICVERLGGDAAESILESVDEIVAVPATARATRRRGYHPAEVLAQTIARRLGVRFDSRRLRKVRETERQSRLALDRRRANVRGAFRVRGAAKRRVLLVDDVATSGWTARECAGALVEAGASRVDVWCFARASRDDFDRGELSVPSSQFSAAAGGP